LKLVKKFPYLIDYYDYSKEGKYYNQNNIYRVNDHLPYNLIYKENLYYYIRLMSPIYFYLDNFCIFDIENNIELAFFTPLIAAMGGNVGVQSAAIIVQGLASNNLGMDSLAQRLMKELGVALLNGIICSGLIMIITSLIGYPSSISFTVSISLMAVIIFAALFGTFIPLALDKYKIDPALATGPFITTVNDVLGLFIYFMIGKLFLNL